MRAFRSLSAVEWRRFDGTTTAVALQKEALVSAMITWFGRPDKVEELIHSIVVQST